ncbi:glucosamine-6-phosphate deaminase [Lacticigenium naphthae]|uniref:glucosamine-6-phosphate deaminase n=1 Tax=Lacticigenium naphthae TaxID=515351 RepID=UPI00042907D9|nr:glucosamine-6-phosphate deaminase [Lacticigenium naphthae]
MEVIIMKDKIQGGKKACDIVKNELDKGAGVFGLATGSSPETLYEELRKSDIDFSDSISINLDEYVGIPADHPQSYHMFMQKHLFNDKPFKKSYLPDGMADAKEEIERYNEILEKNPIDLQILGIGTNGHIGFNEPHTPFNLRTHKVKLTKETIEANKRFFEREKDVPKEAYSMGVQSILEAKKVILLAYGDQKADVVKQMIEGPVTEEIPASALQTHPDVTIILDEQAAKLLS